MRCTGAWPMRRRGPGATGLRMRDAGGTPLEFDLNSLAVIPLGSDGCRRLGEAMTSLALRSVQLSYVRRGRAEPTLTTFRAIDFPERTAPPVCVASPQAQSISNLVSEPMKDGPRHTARARSCLYTSAQRQCYSDQRFVPRRLSTTSANRPFAGQLRRLRLGKLLVRVAGSAPRPMGVSFDHRVATETE